MNWAEELKAGDEVRVFGIHCIGFDGVEAIIFADDEGELYIPCDDGRHYIDGQWDVDSYIGIVKV